MKPEIEHHASRPINSPSTPYASTVTTMNNSNNHNNALFGKYEFGRLLGCGAFAKVYLARNVATGQTVAVKVINKKKIAGTSLASNIKREISIMRRLRHPYIVRLFEVMATRSKIYFVMELVKGGELFSRVAKSRFSEDLSRKYFQQLISAIGYCHSRGVYHRDLKPENLLVDENGDLKVSDFGLSAVKDHQRQQQTLLQTLCGTPAYVAPEILTKKGYDGSKVDIWSSGIILFVLNAGYLPFNDPNLMNMYRKIYKGEFRCPKWFSSDLKRFLTRLLDTNPATRMTIDEITRDPWFVKGANNYYSQNQTISKYMHDCDDDEEDYGCDDNLNEDDISSSSSTSTSTSTSTSSSSSSIAPNTNNYRNRHTFSNEVNDHHYSLVKEEENGMRRCSSLNAFDLISFSSGLDLSGLFDKESNTLDADRFFSAESPDTIMDRIQSVVEGLCGEEIKLKMIRRRRKKKEPELLASLDLEDPIGNLVVNVEIRLLTDVLVVVELKRGEAIDYNDVWKNKIRPHLDDLVYQGSESNDVT